MLSINFSTCIAQHLSRSLFCITSESLRSCSCALLSVHLLAPLTPIPFNDPFSHPVLAPSSIAPSLPL
jgi:hypothetical protein